MILALLIVAGLLFVEFVIVLLHGICHPRAFPKPRPTKEYEYDD